MFFCIYKTTIKTLFRSMLFWVAFVLVVFVIMKIAVGVNGGYVMVDSNDRIIKDITDLDSEYVLSYDKYIQKIFNYANIHIMCYAVPLFCVVSTMLVLNRDYGDGFYEIEKSGGVKISRYYGGRLIALITVNVIVGLFVSFLSINYYYFSRGGVESFTLLGYFWDSIPRILRVFFCSSFPGILFYIGLTYMAGNILRSGFAGVTVGCGYVLFVYTSSRSNIDFRMGETYSFINPAPEHLAQYWGFYDTPWFASRNPWSNGEMLLHLGSIMGIATLCLIVSFVYNKKRNL